MRAACLVQEALWQPRKPEFAVWVLQKMQAGRLVLCEAELESVEGRKMWMKATVRTRSAAEGRWMQPRCIVSHMLCMQVRDKPGGKIYATSRALFVVPKTQSLIKSTVKYVLSGFMPKTVSVE